jgi:putative membrane protein
MMLVPILVIVLVYLMVSGDGKKFLSKNEDNPERVLKERFVNGEIDEETYLKMKSVLKK